jgi:hypothetical protein
VPILPEATQLTLINKLREGAYEARRKRQEAALLGLRKMWSKTWVRMSPQSQSVDGLKRRCTMLEPLLRVFDHLRLRRAAKLRFAAERSDSPAYDGDRE